MSARDELDQIRQRAEDATDGPWVYGGQGWVFAQSVSIGDGELSDLLAQVRTNDADAEFIAAARTDVPRLVAALTAALDLADEYERDDREHIDRFGQHHPVAYHPYPRIRAAITEHLTRKGKPHLAIAKLTSWRETATAIAAGLGTQPVEWLDEDDAVRDDGDLVEGFVDGFLAAHEAATPRSGSTSAPTQIEKGDRA